MYLWDSNVLRYYFKQHPTLMSHLQRVTQKQIALPSVVVAEALRGRAEYLLKATAEQIPMAEKLLAETIQTVQDFATITFSEASTVIFTQMLKQHKSKGRYADLMIAALAKTGDHIVVTRNTKDFADLLPNQQLQNWIDDLPMN